MVLSPFDASSLFLVSILAGPLSALGGVRGGLIIVPAPGVVATTAFTHHWTGLLELRPIATSQLGLLVLIATSVGRVAVSMVGFPRERNAPYVAITLVVLPSFLASLFLVR